MTEEAYIIKKLAEKEGLSLSNQQSEALFTYIFEYGLKLTMKTILEVIVILWITS